MLLLPVLLLIQVRTSKMSLVADAEVFDRLRDLSPVYKKSNNLLFHRHLGFGSTYGSKVQHDHNLALQQLGVIVDASGIKTAISDTGMAAVLALVLSRAESLDVNNLLAALAPNNKWIHHQVPLMSICRHALKKAVCFDTLLAGMHGMRDTKIFPNNILALGNALHG